MRKYFFIAVFFATVAGASAQRVTELRLPVISQSVPVTEILQALEVSGHYRAFYLDAWLDGYQFTAAYSGLRLGEALQKIFAGSDITFEVQFGYALIFLKEPSHYITHDSLVASIRSRRITHTVVGSPEGGRTNAPSTIQGKISDESGRALQGATVIANEGQTSVVADGAGEFTLTLPKGPHLLEISYVNHETAFYDINLVGDGILNITLEEQARMLDEVEVRDDQLSVETTGISKVNMTDLRRAPVFIGESDIFKQIQLQAGVTTTGEIASGFNVRGGSVDQNLVLHDGVQIFNTAHAFGFFSSFNPDAVSDVTFYRGGIPAEYGGRSSSVLDIRSRNGDPRKWGGSGGIGIISSFFSMGGPIRKDTTTLFLSFRTSYSNWILDLVKTDYQNLNKTSVDFYDGSLKLNHRISKKSTLALTGYISRDAFSLANDTVYESRNATGSIRLIHQVNKRMFADVLLSAGQFFYSMTEPEARSGFELNYSILYPSLKIDFSRSGNNPFSFGLQGTYYRIQPGRIGPTTPLSAVKHVSLENEQSLEFAAYFSQKRVLTSNITLDAGVRAPVFLSMGPGSTYRYLKNPPEQQDLRDTVQYKRFETMKSYFFFEPRLSLNVAVNKSSSVKIGYNRITQFLHLINNTAAVTPVDIWQSSNEHFKPQIADQLSAGYYRNHGRDKHFESFMEVFYKRIKNVLDFRDGADLLLNPALETALVRGAGTSYGIELSVAKVKGRLSGDIQYTYSRSFRRSYPTDPALSVNGSRRYPSNQDQPHVATTTWRYGISKRYFFSGTFTYHTGRPMSLPLATYSVQDVPISGFSDRNLFRMADYHRLDLALIMEGNHKKKKLLDGTWILSFYNVYARKNPYAVFFEYSNQGYLKPYQLSIIGTIIPSLSYNFKF